MEEYNMTQVIKDVLKKYNMTQKDLAEKMGKSYISVKQMITRDLRISSLVNMAEAIGCSPTEFFPQDEQKEETNVAKLESDGTYSIICPDCGKKIKIKIAATIEK